MRITILFMAIIALLPACVMRGGGTTTARRSASYGVARDGGRLGAASTGIALVPLSSGPAPVRGSAYTVGKGLRRILVAGSCGDDERLWYCAHDRWLVGENRRQTIEFPDPGPDNLLAATDLGMSVRFGPEGRTIVYLGDSAGRPSRAGCGTSHPLLSCNDAILVAEPADRDPDDGVSASVAVEETGQGRQGFVPLVIPGINGEDPLPQCPMSEFGSRAPCLGRFNVPTGVAAVRMPASLVPGAVAGPHDTDAVILWYGTSIARAQEASWLAVSADGFRFRLVRDRPFSRDRFIQVAPVLVRAAQREAACRAEPTSPLCDKALGLTGDALLLIGTGETYRKGRLFLGLLRLSDLAAFYYRADPATHAESWSRNEADATPIIDAGVPEGGKAGAEAGFSEISARLVGKDACPAAARERCEDTIVLLASQGGLVRYRTAPLAFPGARGPSGRDKGWSAPLRSNGTGYGPYILDAYTRVEESGGGLRLVMYHTISAWNGLKANDPARTPYGVFTHRLMLLDEPTCRVDDRGEPHCSVIPPPWPPTR
ncbi:MAG: hypothetical protein PHU25_11485 [Deltaproteobacteria bacterium]|nr:hypothetical protein [Deltaproteobacteria bacterium]